MRSFVLGYQDINRWCSTVFGEMRKTRRQNLASVVFGVLSSGKASIAAAARAQGNGKAYATNRQRLRRFLKEKNITLSQIGGVLVRLVIVRFPKTQLISVILDTTSLVEDEVQCLTAAVAWKGRALPIAAFLYKRDQLPFSQNQHEERFIRWLVAQIPKGYQICLVADRGFGRVDLIQVCQQLHLRYVIRVKDQVTVEDEYGKKGLLSRRWCKLGTAKLLSAVKYRSDGAVTTNLVITREPSAKETWYLVTNLDAATEATRRYEQRFQIEETFKDAKHQVGLEHTLFTSLRRLAKMVAAVLVSILILLFLGKRLEKWRFLVDRSHALSQVALSLWLLKYPPPGLRRACLLGLAQAQRGGKL